MTKYEKDFEEVVALLNTLISDLVHVVRVVSIKLDDYENYKKNFKVIK